MGTEKGFRYGRGGIDYILSGNGGCSPSDDWFAKGFACNYGTAAVEEDYATLAGYALSDWEGFSKRALKHEKIARKFMGLIQFYNSFDSRMDELFWTGRANYGNDGTDTGNVSPFFFLDDVQVTGTHRRPEYRISDLLSKEPSLDYTRELKEKTRREGYNSSAPQVINDTVKLYRVSLFPPGEKKNRISMLVIPGMRMNFQPGEHMRVSNYWAIAVQEVALQPLRAFTGGDGGTSGKKGADHSSDERIFFIEDVLDRERDRKYLKPNAPVRTIYLSTVQGKSG
ncbi:MAG: hypothetical protein R6W88_12920, partial [Desulfobacterales bacterium]